MLEPDPVGVLRAVSVAGNYRKWMFRKIEPELGSRVLDIGSGLGDFAELFARPHSERRVILSDASKEMTEEILRRTTGMSCLEVMKLDVSAENAPSDFPGSFVPDTVTCINVLEHIEDDIRALSNMRKWVVPGGRLVLLVPALDCLYGSFDRLAGHYRRYDRRKLSDCLKASGWALRRLEYFNFWGMFSWFLGGRILRQKEFNPAICGHLDRLVPLLSFLEKVIRPPVGQSLIAVAENPL
ncbi:MAG: methyltransferase domain-containing protein [Candidatus Omnitrophota bacterium]